ncbi:hypothetical protein ABB37_08151 [Leptomonas pyrrhocoris]|uniref:Uncharacterized protein n=1 Tax=Leptomonas pyrrhocoris TaxID=157538 RepID=A0A0N0DSS0_LEPPY|nr:hypothetical protein ABB37_08151 [Leptomonas pyrrhocoris]KPA76004.1 hypothetical protein ABB37_08151 [Leptomonas pyrrhocoris]|eukprot:XP_015654443.1 hypothetical protein ABB37_08151 [Leptomonas pyrrhocoris]
MTKRTAHRSVANRFNCKCLEAQPCCARDHNGKNFIGNELLCLLVCGRGRRRGVKDLANKHASFALRVSVRWQRTCLRILTVQIILSVGVSCSRLTIYRKEGGDKERTATKGAFVFFLLSFFTERRCCDRCSFSRPPPPLV